MAVFGLPNTPKSQTISVTLYINKVGYGLLRTPLVDKTVDILMPLAVNQGFLSA